MFQTNCCNQRTIFIKKTHCCNRVHKSVSLRPFHTSWDIYSNNMQQYIHIYIYIHMLNATMVNRNRPKQEHVGAEMLPDLNWPELLPMPWMALAEFGCPSKIPFIRYINGAWNDLKNYQSAVANALFQHNFYDPPLRDPPEMDTTVTSKIKKTPARRVGQLRIMFPNDFPFAASKSEWHVIL